MVGYGWRGLALSNSSSSFIYNLYILYLYLFYLHISTRYIYIHLSYIADPLPISLAAPPPADHLPPPVPTPQGSPFSSPLSKGQSHYPSSGNAPEPLVKLGASVPWSCARLTATLVSPPCVSPPPGSKTLFIYILQRLEMPSCLASPNACGRHSRPYQVFAVGQR